VGGTDPHDVPKLNVLEWYEPRGGYREMLVTVAEQDRVAATLRERKYRSSRVPWRVKEYGHAMVVPVLGGESGDEVVALVQLLRNADEGCFDKDDEYLALQLGRHLAHSLRRARLLDSAQEQISQMQKLHKWATRTIEKPDQLCDLAKSLFPSDDVAMYTIAAENNASVSADTLSSGGGGGGKGNKLSTVVKGSLTPPDSVNGLEVLCSSGSSLALSPGAWTSGSKGFESLLGFLRRPQHSAHRSMLCCPALVHKTVLGLGQQSDNSDEAPVVPVLIQWVNSHGRAFGRQDVKISSAFTDVLGRIASEKTMTCSVALLEERFRIGDRRRNALMESARMLANRMEMKELFAAVMHMAKDLMEVERSTLFMVDKKKNIMYTIVADGVGAIQIPADKGLAGAAFTTGKLVNIADAYFDPRFNREVDVKSGFRTKSVLCFPIFNSRDEVIAVIQLINKKSALKFNRADEELIAAFCAQLAVSIENVLAIEEMNHSNMVAAKQKARMLRFLDFVRDFVQGLPAHEVCEVAYKAAMQCTDSSGAALFICKDSQSSEVLPAQSVDIDAMINDPTRSLRRSSNLRSTAKAKAPPPPEDEDEEDLEKLVQAAPPIEEGMPPTGNWVAVTRLCHQVLVDREMVEAEVDINDRDLPSHIKSTFREPPLIVPCLATPIVGSGADDEVQGVLAVWGPDGEAYSSSDHMVIRTLATLAHHLLSSLRKAQGARKELHAIQTTANALQSQRESLVKFAHKLGVAETTSLHKIAASLPPTLNCSACTLWLVKSATQQQHLVTLQPPAGQQEDAAEEPSAFEFSTGRRNKTLELSLNGQGILGRVLTARTLATCMHMHTHRMHAHPQP